MAEAMPIQDEIEVASPRLRAGGVALRFFKNPIGVFGLAIVVVMILVAVFAPAIAPRNPLTQFPSGLTLQGAPILPQWSFHGFFLGTDNLGRDELSQLIFGARVSIEVGIFAAVITMVIGTAVGVMAGYLRAWADTSLMRFTDMMLAFPFILFVILVNSILPHTSVTTVYAVIGILGWAPVARIARAQTLTIAKNEYVMAARSLGASKTRIILRHILPNIISPVIVFGTLQVANFILLESALSFLGAGVPDPIPSWGKMLSAGMGYYLIDPYLVIWPGLMLIITTVGFNFFGDGLNDALSPDRKRSA